MSQRTVTFSSGCGALGTSAFGVRPGLRPLGPAAPGTIVSSARLALARPPEPMNAMFSLLLRFCPRKIAGAPAITPAVISVRPTNSRRVIARAGRIFAESFMELPSSDHPLAPFYPASVLRGRAREGWGRGPHPPLPEDSPLTSGYTTSWHGLPARVFARKHGLEARAT